MHCTKLKEPFHSLLDRVYEGFERQSRGVSILKLTIRAEGNQEESLLSSKAATRELPLGQAEGDV